MICASHIRERLAFALVLVLDADIEFNNDHHTFDVETPPRPSRVDIESVIVHELGHLLGFAHTTDPTSVMVPSEEQGEIRRQPNAVDKAGVCDFFRCYE
jgi:predicted Zn-dependent protease